MTKIPPLPASHMQDPRYGMSNEPAYTADQMNAHALATWNAALEAAAKAADSWRVRSPNSWNEVGQTTTAEGIASAIRFMKEPQ